MGDAREYFALAAKAFENGLSVAELDEAIEDKLAAKAAARETTFRATIAPRPEDRLVAGLGNFPTPTSPSTVSPAGAEPTTQAHTVTAEELFANVPPALQSKRRQKYVFPPELLDDGEAFETAQSIANARNYKVKQGIPLTSDEDTLGLKANSFVNQARTRRRQKRAKVTPSLT
jgi:hypothetical protein